MANIAALLRYWVEEPPVHVILALKYLGERKPNMPTEVEAKTQLRELAGMLGENVRPGSPMTRDLIAYTEEMKAKLSRGKNGR